LDSLNVFEEKSAKATSSGAVDDPETVRTHAYELAFASVDEMFHSTLYDWLIDRGLADELLEVCDVFWSTTSTADPPFHAIIRCTRLS
jgi:nuclear pore complex protein Nup155